MTRVDLLQREPARLVEQVDEAEVPGAEHDHVLAADVLLRRLPLAARRLVDGASDRALVLVTRGGLLHIGAVDRPPDELLEAVPVPLLEGRPLRLPVVGEDDDLVRPRRVAAGALDPAELLVELAQRLHRVGALEARVVRDLVVAREGRVDRGAPLHHVGEDAEDDQVADDDAEGRPQEGVDAAAVAARAHVAPPRLRGRDDLEDDLPAEEDERAQDVEAVGEERAVAGVRVPLGLAAARREDHVVGLARRGGSRGSRRRSRAGRARRCDGARSRRSPPAPSTP